MLSVDPRVTNRVELISSRSWQIPRTLGPLALSCRRAILPLLIPGRVYSDTVDGDNQANVLSAEDHLDHYILPEIDDEDLSDNLSLIFLFKCQGFVQQHFKDGKIPFKGTSRKYSLHGRQGITFKNPSGLPKLRSRTIQGNISNNIN